MNAGRNIFCAWVFAALCLLCFALPSAYAAGTWVPLANQAPSNIQTMLLLSDGTVIGEDADYWTNWYKLTPDIHGSYVNGTWSVIAPMHYSRLYCSSDVMTNGKVFIAGGEYGTGTTNAEIYDPVNNAWTILPVPAGLINTDNTVTNFGEENDAGFMDSFSVVLANGKVLVTPVVPANYGQTVIYNPAANTWSSAYLINGFDEDEATGVVLPDNSVVIIDNGAETSERFIPSLNQWVADSTVPDELFDPYGDEEGGGFLLPNGNAFFIGSTPVTAIYTPTGTTSPGTWMAGPPIPNSLGQPDAPSAMMVNGKILCALSPTPTATNNVFTTPTYFYEYDYSAGTNGAFTEVSAPGGGDTINDLTFPDRFLDLPDGTVLFTESGTQLYEYVPDGSPLAAGAPAIANITQNADGSFLLAGTLLNGISEGACYGDDAQMNTGYPIIRMTNNATGNVYYSRTYNWSTAAIMTGSNMITTDFAVPTNVPVGVYSLVVVANGNSSTAVPFNYTGAVGSLGVVTNIISGGNGTISFDGCYNLTVVLANEGLTTATGIQATLSSSTYGAIVGQGSSSYPNIPINGSASNETPFTVSTIPAFVCGTPVNLELVLKSTLGTQTNSIQLATAGNCVDGGGTCPGADVSLTMSASPGTVFVGSNVVYTLVVSNAGPSPAQNVVISQGLPAGAINVAVLNNGVSVGQTASNLSMSLGSLPVYGAETVPVSMTFTTNTLGQNLTGLITSAASVTSSTADPNLNNNEASATVLVTEPEADLAVTISATPPSVLQGGLVTYTIDVTNNGPFTADGVTLSTTLPSDGNFVSATASQGTVTFNGTFAQLGNIAVGTNVVVTVVVSPAITGSIEASTTVALGANSFEVDPNSLNNSAAVFVTVGPAADLGISAIASPSPVLTGGTIGYIVTVSNQGPSAASTINVTQTLPAGSTGLSSTLPTHTITGGQISGTIPSLASGASTNVINVVRSPSLGAGATSNLVCTFTVGGQPADPNSSNNVFTLTTEEEPPTEAVAAAGVYIVSGSVDGAVGTNGTYEVELYLQNAGNVPTTNLVATLQSNSSLTPVHGSNTFNYHALAVGSAPVPGAFAFTINSSNGATVSAVLQLADNSYNLGAVTFNFTMPSEQTFTNAGLITIPNPSYKPGSAMGPANPYPSTIAVSNVTGVVSGVSVTVSNLFHTYPNDIGMLLIGPTTNCALMSAVAADSTMSAAVTITFSANAGEALPGPFEDLTSGVYLPTDNYESQYGAIETFSNSPAPVGPYNTSLNVFANTTVNGTWSLYVEDDAFGNAGVISNGWSLSFTTVTPVNQVADLAAAITPSSSQVFLGAAITNIWTITDNGPDAVTNVYVTNILSAGLALSTNIFPVGTATIQTGPTNIFNLGNLSVGASVKVTNVVVAGADGLQTNLISAGSSVQDPNPANNAASAVATVNPPPVDLVLPAIIATPDPAVLGGNLVYTVGVTNTGPDNAYDVVGTFNLTGLQFGYAVLFPSSGTSYSVSGSSLNCNLGTIPAGGSAEVTIAATASSSGILTNVWTVTTTSDNTNLANNSISSRVTVTLPVPIITNGPAALVSQGGPPFNGAINNNQTNTVSFTLLNVGTGAATDLVATLAANSGVRPITVSQDYGPIAPSSSTTRSFTFAASGGSGAVITVKLSLQDGSNTNLSPVDYTFALPGTLSFTNTGSISIPYIGPATPYPSSIDVSAPANVTVSQTTATLNGFAHTWPQDVEAVLVSPAGQKVMLMEHTGEYYPVSNLALTFSDAATESLPADSTLSSGTFFPTEYAPFDTLETVGAVPANSTNLNVFSGTDPNGIWSLYVYDDSEGNDGVITGGWTLNLTTITPLPVAPTLAAARISAQTLQLTVTGSPLLTYGVQMSTNLVTWTTIATNTTTGNFSYTDSFTNGSHRFYRAIQVAP